MLKNERGITLVALVVTIIILIILATISISIAFNSGLIKNAEQARDFEANAEAEYKNVEDTAANAIYAYTNGLVAGSGE